ncbi:helix-turn-helix domain-containing protein [Magnetospirillum sp. XM-1]|uniref:helix-turn-helix domain-containing protein n=1 Tax=Magnetospirillum sp. XM-1 TaxID=1663591 RepID=UPI001E2D765D|nr:helix-turn-helix transcriptional regulator [Magnetospirillum sp. XM-1]
MTAGSGTIPKKSRPISTGNRSTRGRLDDGAPNPVDVHVGGRMRLRRTLLGMSQETLGEKIGLTFQQVQKYERGANRIGASRLFDLSRVLDVPVSYFFDDMAETVQDQSPVNIIKGGVVLPEAAAGFEPNPMNRRETLELVRAYYNITDPKVRQRVYELAKALAAVAD